VDGGGTWSNIGDTTTNATYTIPTPTLYDDGNLYQVVVGCPCGGLWVTSSPPAVLRVSQAAVVDAGASQTVCASSPATALAGSFDGAATRATWSGAGTFAPDATTLNAVYTPAAAEIAAGSATVTLTNDDPGPPCGPASAAMTITILPAATVSAGPAQTVCANSPATQLAGSFGGGAGSAKWSGAGTFKKNIYTMNAVYTPTAAEIAAGSATVTLTTDNPPGPCSPASASMTITILAAPTASTGSNQIICAGNSTAPLGGVIGGGATGGLWSSSGTGSFAPNAATLNATYHPSAADITVGTVTLTLSTTGQLAPCGPATAQVVVTINALPAITSQPTNLTACAGSPAIFSVTATGAGLTYQWQVSFDYGLTFNNISTATNACYTNLAPTFADDGNFYQVIVIGACSPPVTSTPPAELAVTLSTTASAGPTQTICSGGATAPLGGSVGSGATGGIWSSSGTGTFSPDGTTLDAIYTPSAADAMAGTVTLTLTAEPCGNATAQVVVTINPAATVNAGPNQTVCAGSDTAALGGTVGGGATGGIWTSSGTGVFAPDDTTLNASYSPSFDDLLAGSVTLMLTSTGQLAPCPAATAPVVVTINAAAAASTGGDQTICAGNCTAGLGGSVSGCATNGIWTSSGSGSFAPNEITLNATYCPSAADMAAGSVTLRLTSAGPCAPCPDTTVQVVVTVVTCSGTNRVQSISNNHNGTFTLNFVGTPGAKYYVVASGSINAHMADWIPVLGSTNTASSQDGTWSCVVSDPAPTYYRPVAVNPVP
jgi:hypothetical protein